MMPGFLKVNPVRSLSVKLLKALKKPKAKSPIENYLHTISAELLTGSIITI